jgi:hypothetical protein
MGATCKLGTNMAFMWTHRKWPLALILAAVGLGIWAAFI